MMWLTALFWSLAYSLASCSSMTPAPAMTTQPQAQDTADSVDIALLMNDCNETFRTEMTYMDSLNRSGSFPDEVDITAKCFVRCILERSRVMSEGGLVDPERALVLFATTRAGAADSAFRESTGACSKRNESCMCERSYQFVKCVVEAEINSYYAFKTPY